MDTTESPPTRSLLLATFRDANFRKLLTGQVISVLGDRINQTALLGIVLIKAGIDPSQSVSQSSAVTAARVAKYSADILFWAVLPAVVFAPFALALVDRWNRQRTMIVSDLSRALLVACLPLFFALIQHHYVVYTVVFLVWSFSTVFAPCRMAILPNLLPRHLLLPANAIFSQAVNIATLVGMIAGGSIVKYLGCTVGFLTNAVTYVISAVFIWSLHPSLCEGSKEETRPPSHPAADFHEGLLYAWKTRPVLFQIVFFGLVQGLVAIFFVGFLSYSTNILRQTVQGTPLLFAAIGIGMAGGAIFLGHSPMLEKIRVLPMIMMACAGVGILVLGFVTHTALAACVLVSIGFAAIIVFISADTYLQKHVPDQVRGRVFTVRGFLVGLAFLFSLQFSKAVIFHLGVLQTFRWIGLASILLSLVAAWIGSRLLRDAYADPRS
jgi:MFS family permease